MIDYTLPDPTISANDLHDKMLGLHSSFKIDDLEDEVKILIARYTDPRDVPMKFIDTKSFDIKKIMIELGRNNPQTSLDWDASWTELALKYDYKTYMNIGLLHRNCFQNIRRSYLMYQIGQHTFDEPPKMGMMQYHTEKYIEDVIFSSTDYSVFSLVYENFDGDNETIRLRGGQYSTEHLATKPKSHWVGKTVFDSFYMIPVLEYETEIWKFVPVDLIRSMRQEHKNNQWGESDSEF
jgi:hypothetical protein